MAYTETFAQELGIIDKINSQSINNTSANSSGVAMTNFRRVAYLVELQAAGAAGTLNGYLQASTQANFASATNLAGTNLTQLNASNTLFLTEVRGDQVAQALQTNTASPVYVRLVLTGAGNAVTVEAIGFGKDAVQRPASNYNLNASYLVGEAQCSV